MAKIFILSGKYYTAITCGACGHVLKKFSRKHSHCPICGSFESDRDVSEACSIIIKRIAENGGVVVQEQHPLGLGMLSNLTERWKCNGVTC